MAKYRHDLPQRHGGIFLTDGGMETTLIFHEGIELPHFAAFVLLDSAEGRQQLKQYYASLPVGRARPWHRLCARQSDMARQSGLGREARLRCGRAQGDQCPFDCIPGGTAAGWERPGAPCVISGAIGPRGDGYKAGNMDADEAEAYHRAQIAAFVEGGADMVTAYTLNSINEAIGVARAARSLRIPAAISFTVETDGRLVKGETLREAIETVDRETDGAPEYFLINCAHPTHFEDALKAGEAWTERIHGVRANASTKSHAELDESETLDSGDPADLGRRYLNLRGAFPKMRILGGCCGTDHRHAKAICEACVPPRALKA